MSVVWDTEKEDALRALWGTKSPALIAKDIGVGSRHAVYKRAERLGLRKPRTPSAKDGLVHVEKAVGQAMASVASAMISRSDEVALSRPIVVAEGETYTVLNIGAHQCKWPIGNPESLDFKFCGEKATRGSYCDTHGEIAYQAPEPGKPRTGNQLASALRRFM